jgi:hypothetical protein
MPATTVLFYRDDKDRVPVLDWLRKLRREERKAYAKCVVRIRRLAEEGYDLRRPEADYLHDGIHELRAKSGRVNYRILYFFHGRNVSVLVSALTKESEVPAMEMERALERKVLYEKDPERHTYEEDLRVG